MKKLLLDIYHKLFDFYGPQHWWPAQSKFEMIVGAILTQNTSWSNVEKAIDNLKKYNILSLEKIIDTSEDIIKECIKPAGYYNQKAERLKFFCSYINERYNNDLDEFLNQDLKTLREKLLSIKGIGPETADSIILYASEKPIFVIDAYTKRLFYRLGIIDSPDIEYHTLQKIFMDNLDKDSNLFNEYHALIVIHCKNACTKKQPKCFECVLFDRCKYKA
ncbi:endonuclease III domain-containing protein [Caldicellulosiruptoraceae bacterium PP1]